MFAKILVAVDGSGAGPRTFDIALDLARHYGAELHVCSVIEDLPRYAEETISEVDDLLGQARRRYQEAHALLAEQARAAGVQLVAHVATGHVVDSIVALADEHRIECIILGGLGRSRILRRTSGGTGTQIAYHAHCSVLVVR